MSKYRMSDLNRNLRFKIQTTNNETSVAIVDNMQTNYDNFGALYYVVAVVLIYGLSIVMMIASHIRRNKQDSQLRCYLKEMAALRKKNRRELLIEKMTDLANKSSPCPNQKTNETSFNESKLSFYGRLPTETDDESQEILLSKNSNSYRDNEDSLFKLPNELSCTEAANVEPAVTPKLLTSKLMRADGKSFVNIKVINENVPH